MLADLVHGRPVPAGSTAYAVTPALLTATGAGANPDDEEAEYAALMLAAEASVLLLDVGDPGDRRRIVLAVDAEVDGDHPNPERPPGEVRLREAVQRAQVAAVHVDTGEAGQAHKGVILVDAAVTALESANSNRLEQALEALADIDLGWYAPAELDYLL
jgi:hypothetical protein